jgi:phosphate-selective porin
MLRIFAIAALVGALLASGASAPQAISAQTDNVTVITKTEAWPLVQQLAEPCDLSSWQDV